MVKKYLLAAAVFLMILFSTSTTTASLLSLRERMYERLQENSAFRLLFGRISQFVFYKDEATGSDSPEGDAHLPKIIDVDGEVTPDDGNETVVSKDDFEDTPTLDINGEEVTALNNESKVDENGAKNETTVEKDGEKGRTLERVIEIITEYNVKIGAMLERVVERTFAPGTTETDVAENIVDTVVVVGGPGGTADNNKTELVVLTDDGQ
jgi:hypothetical protein